MPELNVVIAPDSFKGSATAVEVAKAIAEGWSSVRPSDAIRLLPMADGGEGTVDAFEEAVPGSTRMPVTVTGPVGDPVDTAWLLLPDGTGVVELASASGITLLDPLRALDAHTIGFGEAIAAALDYGVTRLLLAIGGSSSTDGGAGALTALGARALDESGEPVVPGGGGLGAVASVDLSTMRARPAGGVGILSDVTNPLLGANGAAAVFGPQKGADVNQVATLDANLARFAALVDVDPETAGAGAAGGAGFGLLAWGATLAPGADAVGTALGASGIIAGADVVITGEGRFDSQSAQGKVPSYIAGLAGKHARTFLVAGAIQAETTPLFQDAASLSELAGSSAAAIADPRPYLLRAGANLASRL